MTRSSLPDKLSARSRAASVSTASLDSIGVEQLNGVGPRLAAKLESLAIRTVQDALFHLPLRYQDRTKITPIGSLIPGQNAVVLGRIDLSSVKFGRRRSLLTRISDGTGFFTMRQFYFSRSQQQAIADGEWIQCFGEARFGAIGLEMVHPEYSVFKESPDIELDERLTPVYPTTDGVTQRALLKLSDTALAMMGDRLVEWLPADVLDTPNLPNLKQAIKTVHRPEANAAIDQLLIGEHPAQRRLALEELLAHHLALKRVYKRRKSLTAPRLENDGKLWHTLMQSLGFTLTMAQQRVITEVLSDLATNSPAQRLVQGDVGSGKTVVAAAAACAAIESDYQCAVMAPTELLAEQHGRTLNDWLSPMGLVVNLLSGKLKAAARRKALMQIETGEAQLVVGTHALFQQAVSFKRLGLIIIDEQHRFGVDQRLALRAKGGSEFDSVHQITMTATPIPRSLAMTFYADLDVSSIDELPPGRQAVETVVISNQRRPEIQHRICDACAAGRQAYWVCPLIDESDVLQAQAATDAELSLKQALPHLCIGLIHGRMSSKEKNLVMTQFREAKIDLLVATTVIEVGVDVPNASLMIIENSERLGLAQLHQLRGRIGRGAQKSACVLMYQAPLSQLAKARLRILRQSNDGFEIAQSDLDQRGPGEVLGTRQTGLQRLKIADLTRDRELLPIIERIANRLQQRYPQNIDPIIKRWVQEGEHYADA